MDKDSVKAKETAKKKVTRKDNPLEAYGKKPSDPVLSDENLVKDSLDSSPDECLAHGYVKLEADLDHFDNERNFDRMKANGPIPGAGYGPQKRVLESEGEDYGENEVSESSHLDD